MSYEKEARRVVQTRDIEDRGQMERIEIDVSYLSEDEIAGLPEIIDAIAKHS